MYLDGSGCVGMKGYLHEPDLSFREFCATYILCVPEIIWVVRSAFFLHCTRMYVGLSKFSIISLRVVLFCFFVCLFVFVFVFVLFFMIFKLEKFCNLQIAKGLHQEAQPSSFMDILNLNICMQ